MSEPVFAFRAWAREIAPEVVVPTGALLPGYPCADCNADRKQYGHCGFESHSDGLTADYCARTGVLRPWRQAAPVFVPPRVARAPKAKQWQLTLDEVTR